MKRAVMLVTALLLAGCAGSLLHPITGKPGEFPRRHGRHACSQALQQGWCYDGCKKQPAKCCAPKQTRCGVGGCVWIGCNGESVFSVGKLVVLPSQDPKPISISPIEVVDVPDYDPPHYFTDDMTEFSYFAGWLSDVMKAVDEAADKREAVDGVQPQQHQ